jgi:hypothetical protein
MIILGTPIFFFSIRRAAEWKQVGKTEGNNQRNAFLK